MFASLFYIGIVQLVHNNQVCVYKLNTAFFKFLEVEFFG